MHGRYMKGVSFLSTRNLEAADEDSVPLLPNLAPFPRWTLMTFLKFQGDPTCEPAWPNPWHATAPSEDPNFDCVEEKTLFSKDVHLFHYQYHKKIPDVVIFLGELLCTTINLKIQQFTDSEAFIHTRRATESRGEFPVFGRIWLITMIIDNW